MIKPHICINFYFLKLLDHAIIIAWVLINSQDSSMQLNKNFLKLLSLISHYYYNDFFIDNQLLIPDIFCFRSLPVPRRHTPYFGQPDYRIYELNKRLQQRTEVNTISNSDRIHPIQMLVIFPCVTIKTVLLLRTTLYTPSFTLIMYVSQIIFMRRLRFLGAADLRPLVQILHSVARDNSVGNISFWEN